MARYVPDPARRIAVFLGEAGCGKSELSVHWALQAAAEGKRCPSSIWIRRSP